MNFAYKILQQKRLAWVRFKSYYLCTNITNFIFLADRDLGYCILSAYPKINCISTCDVKLDYSLPTFNKFWCTVICKKRNNILNIQNVNLHINITDSHSATRSWHKWNPLLHSCSACSIIYNIRNHVI